MALSPDEAGKVFQSFAASAIGNSHTAIKGVWVALFSAGTFQLIKSFDQLTRCAKIVGVKEQYSPDFCVELLKNIQRPDIVLLCMFYIGYILIFYRFYVGNIRMFDIRYVERVELIKALVVAAKDKSAEIERKLYNELFEFVDNNSRWENIYLLFKTFVIISLTLYVNSPRDFIATYMFLLFLDLGWMFGLDVRKNMSWFNRKFGWRQSSRQEAPASFDALLTESLAIQRDHLKNAGLMFPRDAINIWRLNNSCFLAVLALLFCLHSMLPPDFFYWFGAGLILLNCLIDIKMAWRFYNPRFGSAYNLIRP